MCNCGEEPANDARVPDPDLRLLAAIELEAALIGLPEFPGIRVEAGRPGAPAE